MYRPRLYLCFLFLFLSVSIAGAELVAPPYLQILKPDSVDLYWVETSPNPRTVRWLSRHTRSTSKRAPQLGFHPQEVSEFPELAAEPERYLHHARLSGLMHLKSEVPYSVYFENGTFEGRVRPLPGPRDAVKLIAFADSETEPESTGTPVKWAGVGREDRPYLTDQTEGLRGNLQAVRAARPDALLIAGDLVESGGEQRDWDEFWKQFKMIAGDIPILPAPGNHEYFAGPKHGRYSDEGSQWAIAKYRTYFNPNGSTSPEHYYRKDVGIVSVLSIDCVDGLPHQSNRDSNHYLNAAGRWAPDFHQGSPQWAWLENQLRDCRNAGRFVIVLFHHCPYSSGVHGQVAGTGSGEDPLSSTPARELTQLFLKYGVSVTLCGHDEMFERSEVHGFEELPSGKKRPHTLHVYDIGVAGDGLRGPVRENEHSKFLAYRDSPEVWKGEELISGGLHYGHLELRVIPTPRGWRAELTPVYLLPRRSGSKWEFRRLIYPDRLVLERNT